jgi:hypothetical protein
MEECDMKKFSIKPIGISIVIASLLITGLTVARTRYFGNEGYRGQDGMAGKSGRNGQSVVVKAYDGPQSFNISGSAGENGRDGYPGEDASSCRQPDRPKYDLVGANGGNGGRGGNGGNGGSGGDATIFYKTRGQLKNIILENQGAKAGMPGYAGRNGGYGCSCQELSWEHYQCNWRRMRKDLDNPYATWEPDGYSTKRTECTGDRRYDRRYNKPIYLGGSNPSLYKYRWRFENYTTERFRCSDGRSGRPGVDGSRGIDGRYGNVTLVKGTSIPNANPVYSGKMKASLNKFTELTNNVYVQKTGLQNLLASGSNVNTNYNEYLTTDKAKFTLWWRLPNGVGYYQLENAPVSVRLTRDASNRITFRATLPSNLTYSVEKLDANHWAVRIHAEGGAPSNPTPTPNPVPIPTPAPTPAPTPTPDPGDVQCNQPKLDNCLKYGGGNACYTKWCN